MPRLSDQERQEVMRYLEADQPLPEKYRFLLFEDKRQVELVWNGKTNTVCNVVLPFQTIEQVDEPRAEQPLDATEELQTDLFSTDLRGRQLKGWTNKLIWGDNKLILSSSKWPAARADRSPGRSAANRSPRSRTSWKELPIGIRGGKAASLSTALLSVSCLAV